MLCVVGFWAFLSKFGDGKAKAAKARGLAVDARETLARGDAKTAISKAFLGLECDTTDSELFSISSQALHILGDKIGAERFLRAADAPHDVTALLELSSHLVAKNHPTVAVALLEQALAFAPFDEVVRGELGFAQLISGRAEEAMQTLALHSCLGSDPGVLFQFGWCAMLAGDLESAFGVQEELSEFPAARDLASKLGAALSRTIVAAACDPPDARDYFFLEYASFLLHRNSEGAGRYLAAEITAQLVAEITTAFYATWADGLLFPPPRFFFVDDKSAAVANALAARFKLEAERMPTEALSVRGVLVALDSSSFASMDSQLVHASPLLQRFVLVHDFSEPTPITPNFVGIFAKRYRVSEAAIDESSALRPTPRDAAEFAKARRKLFSEHVAKAKSRDAYLPDAPLPTLR